METIQDTAKHNDLKSLKLQSHCVQINFLFTVRTNINNVIFTFTKDSVVITLFLYFIVFLHFMLVKMIPIIFDIRVKLKQI